MFKTGSVLGPGHWLSLTTINLQFLVLALTLQSGFKTITLMMNCLHGSWTLPD